MYNRLNYQASAPQVIQPLYEAVKVLSHSSLEPTLLRLVELRASQINGCAFCIALHTRELERVLNESGDRISGLPAWREAPWYSDRERAALEWLEALVPLTPNRVNDALFQRVKAHFTDREMAELSLAIATINSWNIFNVGFGTSPALAEEVFERLHPRAGAR